MSTTRSMSAMSSSTSGYFAMNLGHSGASTRLPKLSGALMRRRPRGCSDAVVASASVSATSSRIDFARSNNASPPSVSDSRRDVRLISRVRKWASSSLT
jgi:hypothetical protein